MEHESKNQQSSEAWQPGDNEYAQLDTEGLNREWALVTEAVRRDALAKPEVQDVLVGFADQSVDQTTAAEMVAAFDDDRRVERLMRRSDGQLGAFLQQPGVPEDAITDGIRRHAHGISELERETVARKYAYARDVKLLALGAELAQQGSLHLSDEHEAMLPSGIHIKVAPGLGEEHAAALLDPNKWESRQQIKDRVYLVEADGGKYILKERKTDRHTDTLENGHQDGLTSAEEFETGRWLHDNATKQEDRIKLCWEEPLGYVEYPDGFQFGIFTFQEGLDNNLSTTELQLRIEEDRSNFEAEYSQIVEAAQMYKDHPAVSHVPGDRPAKRSLRQKLGWGKPPQDDAVSFEAFARMKARRLIDRANGLYKETLREAGFESEDRNRGIALRLQAERTGVEVTGFDFEYLRRVSPDRVAEVTRNTEEYIASYPRSVVPVVHGDTIMDQAMYLALMDADGHLPNSIKAMKQIR
jgi:hypothetical protein